MSRGIDAVYGNETCAVVERMLCDEIALYLLRDAKIADHLELITYNALPQQLLPDGKGQVYFTMQNQVMANLGAHGFTSDGGDRSVYGLPGGFPCCVHNYQMGWPLFIASMWMATHTVYVDGVKRGVVRYNEYGKSLGWGSFSEDIYADIHLTLEKGPHTLRIEKTESDVGFAELDAIDQIPCALTGGVPKQTAEE